MADLASRATAQPATAEEVERFADIQELASLRIGGCVPEKARRVVVQHARCFVVAFANPVG